MGIDGISGRFEGFQSFSERWGVSGDFSVTQGSCRGISRGYRGSYEHIWEVSEFLLDFRESQIVGAHGSQECFWAFQRRFGRSQEGGSRGLQGPLGSLRTISGTFIGVQGFLVSP